MQTKSEFEKLKFLYGSVPVILIIHLVSVVFFALVMWQYVDNFSLGVWVGVSLIVLLFRLYHYLLYANSSDEERRQEQDIWLHRYYTYILIGGALWGSTALLLFPEQDLFYQMVVVLFILGITSTALGIISASWYLVIAYVLLSFAPLIIRLAWMHNPLYQTIAYIVSALGILMIFTAKHFGGIIEASIKNKQALRKAKLDLTLVKEQFSLLLDNAPIGIFYYDAKLHVTDLNKRMARILNLRDKNEMVGFDLHRISDKRIFPALTAVLEEEEGRYEGPFFSTLRDRSLYIELLTIPMIDEQKQSIGGICFFKDLTNEMEAKETIRQNAFYDPLTKLPNRTLFTDRLSLAIEQSRRHRFNGAVLFLDLDHFKQVNDNLGHHVGDQLLYKVSQRLLERVRAEDTVARIGGDEFLILLNTLPSDPEEAERIAMEIAEELTGTVRNEYSVEGHLITVSVSIGVYVFSGSRENDPAAIIKHADIAMYHAKRTGRNHAVLYHKEFENSQQEILQMEKELRKALENDEFVLYFQPKVSIKSERIEEVEALIRWRHPEKGLILPDDFIPFAEETGLILKIGQWVFEESVRQIKKWQDDGTTRQIHSVAINVSPSQFKQPRFVEEIKNTVRRCNIPPSMIELELTENIMLDNTDGAIDKIRELESFGIKIALDDFGTGYSSLSYLKYLPVSIIKIDRSFITDLKHNQNSLMIVKTIISIAKSLNLTVVAEGVESQEELKMLEELECDFYQGFFCEKAVPADEIRQLLDKEDCIGKRL